MEKYRRYRRGTQLLVWGMVIALLLLAAALAQTDINDWLLASPVLNLDENIFSSLVTLLTIALLTLWCLTVFSLLAVATFSCALAAVLLLITPVSLFWPALLLLAALWGFNRVTRQS